MNVQELLAEVATAPVEKRAITNHQHLNEAYDYGSAFSRGMRIDLNGLTILLISGTASIDEAGQTVHVGDFRAQCAAPIRTSPGCWSRRSDLARHRAHHLLPARHRARLSGLQRGAHGVLQSAGTRSSAGFHWHPGDSLPPRSADRD